MTKKESLICETEDLLLASNEWIAEKNKNKTPRLSVAMELELQSHILYSTVV